MQYMFVLFISEAEDDFSPEALAEWQKFEVNAAKVATQIGGGALQGSATAKVVSKRAGKTTVTDGPFVDLKEQLGGYYVYDCDTPEIAVQLAAQIPSALIGHVEVRPLVDLSQYTG